MRLAYPACSREKTCRKTRILYRVSLINWISVRKCAIDIVNSSSGMSTAAKRKKPAYDPKRQWGLKPDEDHVAGTATYVVAGHVVSGSNDAKSLFISEAMGRDAQAKASRKLSTKDADRALQELLKKDREGTKALVSARKFGKRMANNSEKIKGEHGKKGVVGQHPEDTAGVDEEGSSDDDEKKPRKNAYSAHLIRQLGFDPTAKEGKRSADSNLQIKVFISLE